MSYYDSVTLDRAYVLYQVKVIGHRSITVQRLRTAKACKKILREHGYDAFVYKQLAFVHIEVFYRLNGQNVSEDTVGLNERVLCLNPEEILPMIEVASANAHRLSHFAFGCQTSLAVPARSGCCSPQSLVQG
jgi:hypothetical protein